MVKTVPAALAVLFLAGCQTPTKSSRLEFVLTPDAAAHSVVVSCVSSSSGSCHFIFAKDGAPVSKVDIETGTTLAVRDLPSGVTYCSAIQVPLLSSCKPGPLPEKRATIKKSMSATGEVSD